MQPRTHFQDERRSHTRIHQARSRNTRPCANPFHDHSCVCPGKGTIFGRGVGPLVFYYKKYPVGFLEYAKDELPFWGGQLLSIWVQLDY